MIGLRRENSSSPQSTGAIMRWTKPEAEIVAVTMEVTAYVATL
jgi:coenzyme PQQ precursor peptide PqqA